MASGLAAAALAILVLGGLVIGCSGEPGIGRVPTTAVLRVGAVTTLAVDRSAEELPTLTTAQAPSTTAPPFGGGTVSVSGTVTGPDGPVAGASVRLERIVGDAVAVRTVGTDSSGAFRLDGVAAGRLRVRAWRAPDLAQTTPVVVFAADRATVGLRVESFAGTRIDWNVAPRPPIVGRAANLVVQLSTRTVQSDGTILAAPLPGIGVTVVSTGLLQGELTEQATDAAGRAVFSMGCYGLGPAGFQLRLASGEVLDVDAPPCSPVPTTTTTTTTLPEPDGASSTVSAAVGSAPRATAPRSIGATPTSTAVRPITTVRTTTATGRVSAGSTTTTLRRVSAGPPG